MSRWPKVTVSDCLQPASDVVPVERHRQYQNFGIYSYARGLFHKRPINGLASSALTLRRVKRRQFVYSRLFAFEGASGIVRIADVLAARLHVGWSRDQTREKEASRLEGSDGLEWLVLNRDATPEIPAASLFLIVQNDDLAVTNIVPQVVSQLSRQQYNLILAEFFENVAGPACRDLNLRCTLTEIPFPLPIGSSKKRPAACYAFSAGWRTRRPGRLTRSTESAGLL
jgi:hypothetical protein